MSITELVGWGSIVTAVIVAFLLGAAPVFVVRLIVAIYPKDDPRRPELIATAAKEAKRGLLNVPAHWYLLGYMFAAAVVEGVPLRCGKFRQLVTRSNSRRTRHSLSLALSEGFIAAGYRIEAPEKTRTLAVQVGERKRVVFIPLDAGGSCTGMWQFEDGAMLTWTRENKRVEMRWA